jgi:hypothetical protein
MYLLEKLPHYYFSWIVSFQKQIYIYICMRDASSGDKMVRRKPTPPFGSRGGGGGVFLGEISSSKHYSKKEKARFGRGLGPVLGQTSDE